MINSKKFCPLLILSKISLFTFVICCKPTFIPEPEDHPLNIETQATQLETKSKRVPQKNQLEVDSIISLNPSTHIVPKNKMKTWEEVLNIITQDYNVVVLDGQNGIITTEWDKFYFNQNLYRNKITLRIRPASVHTTQIIIKNNIEQLENTTSSNSQKILWIPSEDVLDETYRIINSLANVLKLESPKHFSKN